VTRIAHLRQALIAVGLFLMLGVGGAWALQSLYSTPTAAEYLARKPHARLVAAGALAFDGQTFTCGRYPTILDPKLDDYGAAWFGFILVNPDRFAKLPLTIKRYAYRHECGHQYVGYDEGEADCYAIRQGRREGWLDDKALDDICAFISRSRGDSAHAFGERRCTMMRLCFSRSRTGREPL
jgi:hypothetical protein